MPHIEFTQYRRPNGRPVTVTIDRPQPVYEKAQAILAKGLRLECEVLTDERVSFTITDQEECDLAIALTPNGPGVPGVVDRLILEFELD